MQIPHRPLALAAGVALAASLLAVPASASGRPVPVDADADTPRSAYHLSGWASLPADTFVPGSEESGNYTGNPDAPFPGQPVQGFSAVHAVGDGTYLVMSDNGFGAKGNSQDFQLYLATAASPVPRRFDFGAPALACSSHGGLTAYPPDAGSEVVDVVVVEPRQLSLVERAKVLP